MSTNYNVHCADCVGAGPLFCHDVRNGELFIREFMQQRQELIPLARAVVRCRDRVEWFEASFTACIGERVNIEFFAEHDACKLVMRSDQGDAEEEVGK